MKSARRRAARLADKTLTLFAPEIKAMSKAMAVWEPVVEDAARKQGRGPVTLCCECTPPMSIFASSGTALGPNIKCEVCRKRFRISAGQRISEADRAEPTRPVPVPVTDTTSR